MSKEITATVTCPDCGRVVFEVTPDGTGFILKCVNCGLVTEVTFHRDVKIEMVDPEGVGQE